MRLILALLMLISASSVNAEDIKWEENPIVIADVNCDGKEDASRIGYVKDSVIVEVKLGGSKEKHTISFGLGSGLYQSSLCGSSAHLTKELPDYEVFEYGLGGIPQGHNTKSGCYDLNLSGGECDSIHVYWNHNENKLYWWRL